MGVDIYQRYTERSFCFPNVVSASVCGALACLLDFTRLYNSHKFRTPKNWGPDCCNPLIRAQLQPRQYGRESVLHRLRLSVRDCLCSVVFLAAVWQLHQRSPWKNLYPRIHYVTDPTHSAQPPPSILFQRLSIVHSPWLCALVRSSTEGGTRRTATWHDAIKSRKTKSSSSSADGSCPSASKQGRS